ncbi:MAG: asparagine synthase (glutamine-hydrolyzing) [Caulobacteraceae bacterium]
MCGIAGIFASSKASIRAEVATAAVKRMTGSFVHRGPDGHGAWADEGGRCFLGHRRLSIIDTSEAGLQPMSGASGRWVITFNGEIYNYLELRRELEALGVRFQGRTDTEVLIEAIALWGEQALQKLDGMFAFAAFDRYTGKILLARDAFGEKPLYYTTLSNGAFAFASELQAIELLPGFDPTASLDAMAEVLSFQYIGAPRSIYASVRKLEPGSWMTIDADGGETGGRFFRFEPRGAPVGRRKMSDLADELEDILVRSLERRLISDVPLGAFLSGGVDSSVVCALVRRKLGRPLKTFSTGFSNAPESEHLTARAFAEHLGTEHYENLISPDVSAFLDRIGDLLDEPNGDSSCLPTFLLSKFVREHVTVAVSGDGGDEMFGGYGRYFATLADLEQYREKGELDHFHPGEIYYGNRILVGQESFVQSLFGFTPKGYAAHLTRLRADLDRSLPDGLLEEMRRTDAENYMPGAVLPKVDRMSMRNSLEVRTPFLNMEVARFAERMPTSVLVREGRGKIVLRELAYRYLPRDLIDLPKMGFGLPMSDWARTSLLDVGSKVLLADDGRLANAFGRERIKRYVEQQALPGQFSAYQMWGVVMLESWLQKHPAVIPDVGSGKKPASRQTHPVLDAVAIAPSVFIVARGIDAVGRDPARNEGFSKLGGSVLRHVLDEPITADSAAAATRYAQLPDWREPANPGEPGAEVFRGSTLIFADLDAPRRFDFHEYAKCVALGVRRVVLPNPQDYSQSVVLEFQSQSRWKRIASALRMFRHRTGAAACSRKLRRLLGMTQLHVSADFSATDVMPKVVANHHEDLATSYAVFEGFRQLVPITGAHSALRDQAGRYSIWGQRLFLSPTDPTRVANRPYWLVPMNEATEEHLPIRVVRTKGRPQPAAHDPESVIAQLRREGEPINLRPGDRIVVHTHGLPPGGAERQWLYLAQSLKAHGYDVTFVTSHPLVGDNRHYLPDLLNSGIRHVDATKVTFSEGMHIFEKYPVLNEMADHWVKEPARLQQLATTFDRLQPKVVYTQLDDPNVMAGLAAIGSEVPRVVLSFRNYNPTNFPYLDLPWLLPCYRLLSRSKNVVFSGNFAGANEDYARWIGIDPGRVVQVPNAIDEALFPQPTAEELQAVRTEIGLQPDESLVLGVFRLSPEKNPLLFIDVSIALCRADPKLRCAIAGVGGMDTELQARIDAAGLNGRILLLGRRNDVHVLMSLSALLLQTSNLEGMPNAVMEAQLLGTPVVATRAGGTPDVVIEGRTGLLADVGDGAALIAHCQALLSDPKTRKAMGVASRKNIIANFQKAQLGERYLKAVDKAAVLAGVVEFT